MERCYQFAEHYFRVMRAANAPGPEGKGRSHARAMAIDYKTHILDRRPGQRRHDRDRGLAARAEARSRCRRKSTRPATVTRRSRSAPRPPSYGRTATGLREEDGIGQSGLAAGEPPNGLKRHK